MFGIKTLDAFGSESNPCQQSHETSKTRSTFTFTVLLNHRSSLFHGENNIDTDQDTIQQHTVPPFYLIGGSACSWSPLELHCRISIISAAKMSVNEERGWCSRLDKGCLGLRLYEEGGKGGLPCCRHVGIWIGWSETCTILILDGPNQPPFANEVLAVNGS